MWAMLCPGRAYAGKVLGQISTLLLGSCMAFNKFHELPPTQFLISTMNPYLIILCPFIC